VLCISGIAHVAAEAVIARNEAIAHKTKTQGLIGGCFVPRGDGSRSFGSGIVSHNKTTGLKSKPAGLKIKPAGSKFKPAGLKIKPAVLKVASPVLKIAPPKFTE
jgi:hypothetical protein